jgi:large subunit ribosomal protein LP0
VEIEIFPFFTSLMMTLLIHNLIIDTMPLSKDKKITYAEKMKYMLNTYTKMFVVQVDNVGSQQLNQTRKEMRGTAEILMGKNTLMRKVLKDFLIDNPDHFYAR